MSLEDEIELQNMPDIPLDNFQLQYEFAIRARELTDLDLSTTLLKFTSFYKRIGIQDWDFNSSHTLWIGYINKGLSSGRFVELAYNLYLKTCLSEEQTKKESSRFGCFRFNLEDNNEAISLHFANRDSTNFGLLSKQRLTERLSELKEMFGFIKAEHKSVKSVRGGSWLYNYPSYCRLYPAAFTENMEVQEIPFPRSSGIWGQFITSERKLNLELARSFEDKYMQATNEIELLKSFPYKILSKTLDIDHFYEFYEVS